MDQKARVEFRRPRGRAECFEPIHRPGEADALSGLT
jgi:hypothetical protein